MSKLGKVKNKLKFIGLETNDFLTIRRNLIWMIYMVYIVIGSSKQKFVYLFQVCPGWKISDDLGRSFVK